MNPRKLSSVQREQKILEIMELFCEENNFDDPVHLCNFAAQFWNYDENASVFEPQLQVVNNKNNRVLTKCNKTLYLFGFLFF